METITKNRKPQLLEIITYGHPVLSQRAREIANITEEIREIAKSMAFTMYCAPGIGLAAPQINRSIRLITVDLSLGEKKQDVINLVNPEIILQEGESWMEEACLSIPEIKEKIHRPSKIVITGSDLRGNEKTLEAEGLLARVFCHEIDHLEGRLFIDRLSPLKRKIIQKKLSKRMQEEKNS